MPRTEVDDHDAGRRKYAAADDEDDDGRNSAEYR